MGTALSAPGIVRHGLRVPHSLRLAAILLLASPAFAAESSFDGSRAEGTVQELICSDAGLAALDRELAEAWTGAFANLPESERATAETTTCRPSSGTVPVADPCEGAPAESPFVFATSPAPGATVAPPFEVAGCSRTFESNVTWRLLARDGSVVAEGLTSGGGVDGPGPFRFVVDVVGGAEGLHHLEVDEPKISDEGFPPGRTVLPLVLKPSH